VGFTITVPIPLALDITVHDLLGRRVATLWRGEVAPGEHRFVWNGLTDLGGHAASGLYVVTARSSGVSVSESVVLLR